MAVRPPTFALQGWYPSDPGRCREAIAAYLEQAGAPVARCPAGIVPHAGWRYSGAVAARTFAALRPFDPELVFLFGGHMRPGERPICMSTGAFGTPVGDVEVDEEGAALLCREFDCELETTRRYAPDNTLELQLPFLAALWPTARVIAVQTPPGEIALALGRWACDHAARTGLRCAAVGSTDLTHYGASYGFTPRGAGEGAHRWSKEDNDRGFLEAVAALDPDAAMAHALRHHSACCPGAAGAAVAFARARGAQAAEVLAHTTSYEVEGQGPPTMWVGYAAVVF